LRARVLPQSTNWESLLREAEYYGIQSLITAIEERFGEPEVELQNVSFEAIHEVTPVKELPLKVIQSLELSFNTL